METSDFLAQQFPVSAVGLDGTFKDLDSGVQFLVANDGLWRHIQTPWLESFQPLALQDGLAVPFGRLTRKVKFKVPAPGKDLWRKFLKLARDAMPNECAAALVWNTTNASWRFAQRVATFSSPAYIEYAEVEIDDGEILVVDIHSHAQYAAGFSAQDDIDDKGGIKLSVVFGNIDSNVTMAARLMLIDSSVPVGIDGSGRWEVMV